MPNLHALELAAESIERNGSICPVMETSTVLVAHSPLQNSLAAGDLTMLAR